MGKGVAFFAASAVVHRRSEIGASDRRLSFERRRMSPLRGNAARSSRDHTLQYSPVAAPRGRRVQAVRAVALHVVPQRRARSPRSPSFGAVGAAVFLRSVVNVRERVAFVQEARSNPSMPRSRTDRRRRPERSSSPTPAHTRSKRRGDTIGPTARLKRRTVRPSPSDALRSERLRPRRNRW